MKSTAGKLAPAVDAPMVVTCSRANCLFLGACVVSLFLFGHRGLAAFSVMTIFQMLRTFVLRTVFYESHLEHRGVFGRTIRADYSNLAVLSSRPEAMMLDGHDPGRMYRAS